MVCVARCIFIGAQHLSATLLDIPGGHFLEAFTYILGPVDTISATAVIQHASSQVVNPDSKPTGEVISVDSPSQVVVSGTLKSGAVISLHWCAGLETPSNVKAVTPLLWVIDGTKESIRIESNLLSMVSVDHKPWTIFRSPVHTFLVIFFCCNISVFNQCLHTEIDTSYSYTSYRSFFPLANVSSFCVCPGPLLKRLWALAI